jgi:hypothetical protein
LETPRTDRGDEPTHVALHASIAQGDGLALSAMTHPHPLLGPLSRYAWIALVGAHEARHAAQLREHLALA